MANQFRVAQHNRNMSGAHKDADMDAYSLLANAIVLQAITDYREALKYGDRGSQKALERWFAGEWCGALTKLDLEPVLAKIRGEYNYD